MFFKVLETLLISSVVFALAFDDIFVDGDSSLDMIDKGRTQYQLLREKGNLPRYGSCWKGALEHVEDGCKNLSEDAQSDMALHLMNCFLEMSGHETYNCDLDKKPNLREICMRGMSDRAFNVYTEFYTHVQNICWFLRGQIWYETISESSFRMGKQLETSARNQEELLDAQRETIQTQEKILKQEKMLESVLGDLYVSSRAHKDILAVLTRSVASFQTWLLGEVSWIDSILFYSVTSVFICILTSTQRTSSARLPLLLILFSNFLIERFICHVFVSEDALFDAKLLYEDLYFYVWCCRDFFIFVLIFYLIYHAYKYQDLALENNKFLRTISAQNAKILDILHGLNLRTNEKFSFVNESLHCNGFLRKSLDLDESSSSNVSEKTVRSRKTHFRPLVHLTESINGRYNLRSSKQNTPDLN